MPLTNLLRFLTTNPGADSSRYLVHSGLWNPEPRGCAIALIDDRGVVEEIARYGFEGIDKLSAKDSSVTVWSSFTPLRGIKKAQVLSIPRERIVAEESSEDFIQEIPSWLTWVQIIPIVTHGIPRGAVALFFDSKTVEAPVFTQDMEDFVGLMSLFLQGESLRKLSEKSQQQVFPEITDRQTRILSLISRGYTNKEIAGELSITVATVKQEVSRILQSLGVKSRKEAVSKARGIQAI